MLLRCIKSLIFFFLVVLSMGTSCIKMGKAIFVIHKVDCPPTEFHFPLTASKEGSSIEMQSIQPSRCKNSAIYDLRIDKSNTVSYIRTSLIREMKSCKIVSVITVAESGHSTQLHRKDIPNSNRFRNYKKAHELLPKLIFNRTKIKVYPNPKFIDTSKSKANPDEWCSTDSKE